MIDEAAGKKHSRDGPVLTTLARLLTRYDELRGSRIMEPARTDEWP